MLQPLALAREPTAWIRAPSQPLMRSLLSQFQTPTTPRRVSRFFRVWLLIRSPCRADHPAYFEPARVISPILSAVDSRQTKQLLDGCQRNFRCITQISVNGIVENAALRCGCAAIVAIYAASLLLELLIIRPSRGLNDHNLLENRSVARFAPNVREERVKRHQRGRTRRQFKILDHASNCAAQKEGAIKDLSVANRSPIAANLFVVDADGKE